MNTPTHPAPTYSMFTPEGNAAVHTALRTHATPTGDIEAIIELVREDVAAQGFTEVGDTSVGDSLFVAIEERTYLLDDEARAAVALAKRVVRQMEHVLRTVEREGRHGDLSTLNVRTLLELAAMSVGADADALGLGDDVPRWVANGARNAEARRARTA